MNENAPIAAAFALLGIVAIAAMGLAGWVCWLLHRHWPKSDTASAKEIAGMLWSAEQRGRGEAGVGDPGEDLEQSAAQEKAKLDAAQWRMERDERLPPEDQPRTVMTVGQGATEQG